MKKNIIRLTLTLCLLAIFTSSTFAQLNPNNTNLSGGTVNTIFTAVPFLRITPDARSGALGDAGISLSPDAYSIYWNTAKLAFSENKAGAAITYTPWLRQLVNDIYLASLTGYYKIDEDQAITTQLRYFSLGQIQFTNQQGQFIQNFNPREFAWNVGYARKLSDHFSMGLNLAYIYSNLAAGQMVNGVVIKAGNAVAGDLSMAYTKDFGKNKWNWGLTIANIGSKITYTQSAETKDFLPTNLGLGTSYTFTFDEYNKLTLIAEANKLLVPTPDSLGTFRKKSVPEGIFGSFNDAPDGGKEELREISISTGAEYWYKNLLAIRAGYFNESRFKGNRRYLTAGLGIKYNVFGLNFSYLIPTSNQRNPLDNTLRFSLVFDFKDFKKTE
jgi:hypothetical protein